MNSPKYIPNRLLILYRLLKRTLHTKIISNNHSPIHLWLSIIYKITNTLIPLSALIVFALVIYDFGFFPFYSHDESIYLYLWYMLTFFKSLFVVRFISEWIEIKKIKSHVYNFCLIILAFYLANVCYHIRLLDLNMTSELIFRKVTLYIGITFLFFTEASNLLKFIYSRRQNPSFIFIISFAIIIIAGTFLLMLPNATVHGISLINALFTSTSAVCVTGLTVVDTGIEFTAIGKVIILFLFQIGGLGIMTFTGLLGYLSTGSVSFHSQMALKSMVSSNQISNVITVVTRIIIVTLSFELVGAFFLYLSLDKELFDTTVERAFFSVFHAVSAFCNAGFSTESAGLYTESFRFNYSLQLIIAVLIILGGMGFPIVFNIFSFLRLKAKLLMDRATKKQSKDKFTRVIQINSRLAMATTFILLVIGFVLYFIFEFNHTLQEHPTWTGKIVTSFFGSVTPRTAGFNTVDMSKISLPIIMVYLLLMWVGASPSSTGGGIKTTTFAVAFLNLRSVIFGRTRTEIHRTQVSELSINRAFAVMMLSLIIIGLTVLLLSIYDGDKGILHLSFEAFSAFSTVGLSLGITPNLSEVSKVVLVVTMFIGRVGALTVLIAFISQAREQAYQYPVEEIMY